MVSFPEPRTIVAVRPKQVGAPAVVSLLPHAASTA
jgi:hypothetical protein